MLRRPCCLVGAGCALFLFPPRITEGWRSAARRPTNCALRRAPGRRALRLAALHRGILVSTPGPAFSPRPDIGLAVSQLLAGALLVAPGGAPAPPGCVSASHARGCRTGRMPKISPRPTIEFRAFPTLPPICPASTTPHDGAPRRTG
jgi:hypothetical protein